MFATMRRSPLPSALVTFSVCVGIVLLVLLLRSQQDLVRAQQLLEAENVRLENAIDEESEARYRFKLESISRFRLFVDRVLESYILRFKQLLRSNQILL